MKKATLHETSNYTITFKTIKLLLRIDTAKERTLLIFSPENISSLREAERIFITKTVENEQPAPDLSSYSPWKTILSQISYATKLKTCIESINNSAFLKSACFIKNKKTKKISPTAPFPFKGKTVTKKKSQEFSEGPTIDYIKTTFFEQVALIFYKKHN